MNLSFELLRGIAVCNNKGAFPITDEPLSITLINKHGSTNHLFITAINGDKTAVFETHDGVATLPEALKKPGELRLNIQLIIDGEVLQTWQTEPIKLKDVKGELSAIPQIVELEAKVKALAEAVGELKNIIIEREEF